MLDGRRKSMQPMAERLQVDHQRLQQFVTNSPWNVVPVRKTLSRKACDLIAPHAWVIDDTGFAKDGPASPGVARQYSGTLGKVANCQIAVSVHAATDTASAALDWRLYLPESWDDRCADDPDTAAAIRTRRTWAAVPDDERHRPKWKLALAMIDELIECRAHTPTGGGRRRLRRHHRVPPRPDRARHPVRGRGQGRDQRPPRRRSPGHRPPIEGGVDDDDPIAGRGSGDRGLLAGPRTPGS